MSKKPKGLLGPDGKLLDVEKYRPKPEPTAPVEIKTHAFSGPFTWSHEIILDWFGNTSKPTRTTARQKMSDGITLAAAVERDVKDLTKPLRGWKGHPENPPPPPEQQDTYAVALDSARRNCEHSNARGTAYANGEYQCRDCGRYFHRSGIFD